MFGRCASGVPNRRVKPVPQKMLVVKLIQGATHKRAPEIPAMTLGETEHIRKILGGMQGTPYCNWDQEELCSCWGAVQKSKSRLIMMYL